MKTALEELLHSLQVRPVLVEVGASDAAPTIWAPIAPFSTYIAIGPGCNTVIKGSGSAFREFFPVNQVVAADQLDSTSKMYIAKDAHYSSLLRPNSEILSDFLDLAAVATETERTLPCSTMTAILARLNVTRLDWFKTNVNGCDFRIFQSLDTEIRSQVLALDTCLDFIQLFHGQDDTLVRHAAIQHQGFWLSRLVPCGGVRLRSDSLQTLRRLAPDLDVGTIEARHRVTPGWAFATYLRRIDSIARDGSPRDYVLLWSFALLEQQFGFALDVALSYASSFGQDDVSRVMLREAAHRLQQLKPRTSRFGKIARAVVPRAVRHRLRDLAFGS